MYRKILGYKHSLYGRTLPVAVQTVRQKSSAAAPRLIYMQNPWTWLCNKMRLKKLQYTWDRNFSEDDFKLGVKQVRPQIEPTRHLAFDKFTLNTHLIGF